MSTSRLTLPVTALAFAAAACGGAIDTAGQAPLEVSASAARTSVSWSVAPDLDARTAEAVATAAEVWGATAFDERGLSVVYTSALIDCAGARAVGCTTGSSSRGWELQILATGAPCIEATTLPHELGHVILGGDPDHLDPRWRDRDFWNQMADRLARSSARSDAACVAFLEGDGVYRVDAHP